MDHGPSQPSSPRDVVVLSAFEGLGCAAGATLAVGPDFIAMKDQGFPGRGIPGVGRLVFTLAALFTVALAAVRLRAAAKPVEWKLGRTAMLVSIAMAAGACASCAVARWDLIWVVPSGLALLVVAALSVAISPGKRVGRAAVAGGCLLTFMLLPITCWPLRLTVWLWRGSLEEIASRVEGGGASSTPQWVGPFMFVKTTNGYDQAFLVTADGWGGDRGLARGTDARSCVNEFWEIRVGSGWWFVHED